MSSDKLEKTLRSLVLWLLIPIAVGIALFPEKKSLLLTSPGDWSVQEQGSRVPLREFPPQSREVRASAIEQHNGQIFRTWTPARGIVPQDIISGPFLPTRFMSVAITGSNRIPGGLVQAYVQCEANSQRLDIFRGSVNVNVAEAIVVTPQDWCPGPARVTLKAADQHNNVGIGDVFEISLLSYLKSSFIGRIPYLLAAFAIFSFVMFAGAAFGTRFEWHQDPLPLALISLGSISLGTFYLASVLPEKLGWISIVVVTVIGAIMFRVAGPAARRQAALQLMPYGRVWGMAGLGYFTILSLTYNGLGHWEPNYRFWPAIWSSDNELPWIFAEAIRHGWDLKGLFGGGWLPTDRPPLMAGAHLLLSDAFALIQANNDGNYLRGSAYNAAAVVLNALWVPAAWWLLRTFGERLEDRARTAILIFVACMPFVLFNSLYGWPKAFGAAFALVAFGLAWQSRDPCPAMVRKSAILLFFALGAFSMLAHSSTALFLSPLGLVFLFWNLRSNTRNVFTGFAIALALVASWSVYKLVVLPSPEPVTKYALTGDFGFGHPEWSLLHMLADRYRELSFSQWLEIKKIMLLQAFLPLEHAVSLFSLNSDFGAGAIDKLRAWDFMLLSKGNIAIPLFTAVAMWLSLRAVVSRRIESLHDLGPFPVLVSISVVAWFLMVFGFLAPVILHHWPQAAVLGLALGSAFVVHQRYPLLFGMAMLALMSYTGVVWILWPLQQAMSVDPGAAVALLAFASWGLISNLAMSSSNLLAVQSSKE